MGLSRHSLRSSDVVAAWAIIGVGITFVEAIARLGARGLETIAGGLAIHEWIVLAGLVSFFCYFEGYRGLQKRFAPLVVARSFALASEPRSTLIVVLAPLYAVALLDTDRRRVTRAWLGVAGIVIAVVLVRRLPAPWRGLVDAGVACALAWGLVAIVVCTVDAFRRRSAPRPARERRSSTPAPSADFS